MTEMFGEAWSPMSVPDLAPDDDDDEAACFRWCDGGVQHEIGLFRLLHDVHNPCMLSIQIVILIRGSIACHSHLVVWVRFSSPGHLVGFIYREHVLDTTRCNAIV